MQRKNKIFLNEKEIEKLKNFEKDFLCFNEHTNLISKNDTTVFFQKHIKDSLSLQLVFKKHDLQKNNIELLDIGTGGGLPSLPLALCYPEIKICAVDSIRKKIQFIQSIKEKYSLKNLEPVCQRIENLPDNFYEKFDVATSRALAKINVLLEYTMPFLKVGGILVAYKSKLAQQEIEEAQNALNFLSAKIIDIIEYSIDENDEHERNLVIIKKVKETDKKYPRKNGVIKKFPL